MKKPPAILILVTLALGYYYGIHSGGSWTTFLWIAAGIVVVEVALGIIKFLMRY